MRVGLLVFCSDFTVRRSALDSFSLRFSCRLGFLGLAGSWRGFAVSFGVLCGVVLGLGCVLVSRCLFRFFLLLLVGGGALGFVSVLGLFFGSVSFSGAGIFVCFVLSAGRLFRSLAVCVLVRSVGIHADGLVRGLWGMV